MKRITLFFLLALAAIVQIQANTAQDAVDKFVAHNSLRYASVGVTVIDLDSAKCIASYRPEQANITASTMKTVVSSAALGLLGPHFRFETPVYLDGTIQDGLFTGNIVIRGLGDPTLGSVFLPYQANIVDEIISALRTRGITERTARTMLAYAFCDEVIRNIGIEPLRRAISDMVKKRLHGELRPCDGCALQCSTPCNGSEVHFAIDPSKL